MGSSSHTRQALVTGARGFLGRQFAYALKLRGYQVREVDLRAPVAQDCLELFSPVCAGHDDHRYDLVVHAAARGAHRRAIDTQPGNLAHNLQLDSALFDWAARTGQGHVLYLSSCAVYPRRLQELPWVHRLCEGDWNLGEEFDDYGLGKSLGEVMAQRAVNLGVPVTIIRTFSGYGETQTADFPFTAFVQRALRREDPFVVWGSDRQLRDFVHVSDVVIAALALVERGNAGVPYNVGTGVGTSLGELARLVCDAVGYSPRIEVDKDAPLGAPTRVANPRLLNQHYTPQVTLAEGVEHAVRFHEKDYR